jgi:glycerophosphodiester phosphodiesterase
VLAADRYGWTAVDHAAFRGHMTVVTLLEEALCVQPPSSYICTRLPILSPRLATIEHQTVSFPDTHWSEVDSTQTSVFLSLGSFDIHAKNSGLEIEPCVASQIHQSIQSHMLLEIACHGQAHAVQLPFLGDISSTTWRFSTTDIDSSKLTFKLFRCTENGEPRRQLLGMAMVLLDSIKGLFRPERQSLKRESTAELITPDGNFAGSVTFTFLVCRPYKAHGNPKPRQRMRSVKSTQVVGHRGRSLLMSE